MHEEKKNDEGYEKATQEMEAGEALLLNRQKMIKLADRSELGWSVVEEYEADELADSSEDEKKIARAEKEAERKAIKRKKRFANGQSTEERQPQRSVQVVCTTDAAPIYIERMRICMAEHMALGATNSVP